jgi:hypothetical protein
MPELGREFNQVVDGAAEFKKQAENLTFSSLKSSAVPGFG